MALMATILLFPSCKKEKVDLTDPVPSISDVTISPTTVVEYEDSLTFAITYRDGDGDLGENNPNVRNLFITDNRINVTEELRISQLSPDGSTITISGTLNAVLKSTGITNGSNSQTANFTVWMVDRAGNESNKFVTGDITVTK